MGRLVPEVVQHPAAHQPKRAHAVAHPLQLPEQLAQIVFVVIVVAAGRRHSLLGWRCSGSRC